MVSRKEVYEALDTERTYQDNIWNEDTTTTAGKHTIATWLVFMRSYMREAEDILSRTGEPIASEKASHIMRKITAMGVACMEQNGAPKREPKATSSLK